MYRTASLFRQEGTTLRAFLGETQEFFLAIFRKIGAQVVYDVPVFYSIQRIHRSVFRRHFRLCQLAALPEAITMAGHRRYPAIDPLKAFAMCFGELSRFRVG